MVYNLYIYGNKKNGSYNVRSMIAPRETGKLGKRISVISVETAHRNSLAARSSNEYELDMMKSGYAANYDMKFCSYGL